ncbi:hypothetical protein quinque_009254 [Culex quinquefasciatus]
MSEVGTDHKLFRHGENLTAEQLEDRRKERFQEIYRIVVKNLEKAHETSRNTYNLRHRQFAKSYNAKYGPQFLPCRIKAKHGSSSYELEDLNGKNLGIWPAAHLKPG